MVKRTLRWENPAVCLLERRRLSLLQDATRIQGLILDLQGERVVLALPLRRTC